MTSIIGNFAKAKRLVGKPNSSLYSISQVLHVPLPPSHLANINGAMMLLLKEELEIFSPELDGVPVAFNEKSVRMLESSGYMISAQPYIHFNMQSEFIVFKPRVGDILNGVINKVTPYLFGCLIHNCFYATIHRKANDIKSISKIEVGKKIHLQVTKLEEDGDGVLSITGEIFAQQSRKGKSSAIYVKTEMDASVPCVDPGIDLAASGMFSQKLTMTSPPTEDFGEDVESDDSSLSKSMLRFTPPNYVYRDPESIKLAISQKLTMTITEATSPNNVYLDPKSIKLATPTACHMVDSSAAAGPSLSSDDTTTSTTTVSEENIVTGEKRKKKKEKKHKHKKKKRKEGKNAKKTEAERDSNEISQTVSPVYHSVANNHENITPTNSFVEESEATATNLDNMLSLLNSEDFFSRSPEKSIKKEPQTPNSKGHRVNGTAKQSIPKPERKSKKRKHDAKAEGFSSPVAKKAIYEDISKVLLMEDLVPSKISEHQRLALFHLQQLGINLPLSALKSSILSSPKLASAVSESNLPKEQLEVQSDKPRKKQTPSNIASLETNATSTPLFSPDKSRENNTQSSANVFPYLKTEYTAATTKKHKKQKRKRALASEAAAMD